ncbi:MAG: sigma-54-dependent transcriptional regulator [Gemmatimonadales bacterium]
MSRGKVLVVDDELDMLDNCRRLLSRAGFDTRTLDDPTGLPGMLQEFGPEVLLLDLRMPQVDGLTALAAALAADGTLPVIIMTAFASVDSAVRAIREGAFDYLTKPFTGDQLVVAVDRALRYRGMAVENRTLREQAASSDPASRLLGDSPALDQVVAQARRAAPTEANVLILGESGTGKEVLARLIHELSPRRGGSFVPIDCTSLPAALMESELFGHERGAFTGAVSRKRGLLAEASGGTVFFDEIGELDLPLQAKLLRALEDRRIRPVGGTEQMTIDIRVVAATNVDLEAASQQGRFRSDLYFRLNVVELRLPPLRARLGDVPILLNHFLGEFARTAGREPPRVSPEALVALEEYHWPGNIRELRNTAQRLVVLDDDGRITTADLPDSIRGWPAGADGPRRGPPLAYEAAREAAQIDFLRGYVRQLLDHHGGNISRAAAAAGVSRRTLHRWIADVGDSVTPEAE